MGADLAAQLTALPKVDLTESEKAGLIRMREEEKLAGDVYRALYQKWQLQPFRNIAGAEDTHTQAVKALLERYDLADPAAGKAAGVFTSPELQALYTKLVADGDQSATEALKIGALIEELDIKDLQARKSSKPDIDLLYPNLERGSRNHLRAFVSNLKSRGVTHVPVHLSQAEYDRIVSAPVERGQ